MTALQVRLVSGDSRATLVNTTARIIVEADDNAAGILGFCNHTEEILALEEHHTDAQSLEICRVYVTLYKEVTIRGLMFGTLF